MYQPVGAEGTGINKARFLLYRFVIPLSYWITYGSWGSARRPPRCDAQNMKFSLRFMLGLA